MSPLQVDEILLCLDRHKVKYVIVGGLAAVLHGSPLPTVDLDICPSLEPSNLESLAAALDEMDARIRAADSPEGVRFPRDATFLSGVELLNLVTKYGDLDLAFLPSGTEGFSELAPRAVEMTIRGSKVAVASLEDVIRTKESANRPKDRRMLPLLRRLLEEIRRRKG
jgi:hypothetical protein